MPQIRGLTIVLIGDFNPTIFQPAWFAAQGFITDEEARTAAIGIIHPDVTAFELSWLKLQVDRERFFSMCLAPPYFPQVVERRYAARSSCFITRQSRLWASPMKRTIARPLLISGTLSAISWPPKRIGFHFSNSRV